MGYPGIGQRMQTVMNVYGLEEAVHAGYFQPGAKMQKDRGIQTATIGYPVNPGGRIPGENFLNVNGGKHGTERRLPSGQILVSS